MRTASSTARHSSQWVLGGTLRAYLLRCQSLQPSCTFPPTNKHSYMLQETGRHQEESIRTESERSGALYIHSPHPFCHRRHGSTSYHFLQTACCVPCRQVGPTILFNHGMAKMPIVVLATSLCHPMHSRSSFSIRSSSQSTSLHRTGHFRVTCTLNPIMCIHITLPFTKYFLSH